MIRGVILAGQSPDAPLRWGIGSEKALDSAGEAPSVGLLPADLRAVDRLYLILPGERIATRRIPLPVNNPRQLEEASRLAFEDVLAEPVDKFHFAFGPLEEGGRRLVSAVPTELMELWMSALLAVNIDPHTVVADHTAVQTAGYGGVFLQEAQRAIASLPEGGITGHAVYTARLIDHMKDVGRLLFVAAGPQTNVPHNDALALADDRALCAFYLDALAAAPGTVNFRRGQFQKRRDWRLLARNWRTAGGLMAACLALWMVLLGIDGARHQAAADRLMADARTQFQAAFPGTPVRALGRQARARLRDQAGSAFLPLSVQLAAAMEQQDAIQLTQLRYNIQDAELVADLRVPDAASLDTLKTTLEEEGVIAREGGSLRRDEAGFFAAQLFLEGGV